MGHCISSAYQGTTGQGPHRLFKGKYLLSFAGMVGWGFKVASIRSSQNRRVAAVSFVFFLSFFVLAYCIHDTRAFEHGQRTSAMLGGTRKMRTRRMGLTSCLTRMAEKATKT